MHKDMISVIIPIYNAEAFLERCLNSVVQNTYENLQILCVDDGSTDGSPEILSRFAAADHRITVLTQANAGVSRARNLGLKHAHGEYVCFVDADDWVHREYFSILHRAVSAVNADMAISNYAISYAYAPEDITAELPSVSPRKVGAGEYLSSGFLTSAPWARIFRRSGMDGLFFPENIRFAEDEIFNICFLSHVQQPVIVHMELPLYFYYQHNASLSRIPDVYRRHRVAKWYLDHIDSFRRRDIMLAHTYRNLFIFRYEGSFLGDRREVYTLARQQLRRAFPYLMKEPGFSLKEKVKHLAASLSPALYRAQLLAKDPTYHEVEKNWKKQKTQT